MFFFVQGDDSTDRPDLLRCPWQTRRPRFHGRRIIRPILHGTQHRQSTHPYLKSHPTNPVFQVLAASRQSWAFSRDGALPLSSFFRKVSQHRLMRYQPVCMVCGCVFAAAVIGLLSLIDNAAANALFSLAVAGNDLAWLTPILARLLWGQDKFVPGEFYTGKYLSKPIAWVAVIYMVFAIVLSMIPTEGPNPSRKYYLSPSGGKQGVWVCGRYTDYW